ncbi:MAG: DegT/DnrJ/EryC1/StrS family aminotransferase [Victivallaceae bacterium]|nr:DegT/DnrJ/EryC1/StrS family aminotransferase [Victivallaceae bacterium]
MAELAVLGGEKLCSEGCRPQLWPPRDLNTAERLKEVYLSGKWSFNSPEEQQFERDFAAFHGAKYAVFMANGTVTLECALTALGIRPGDEVLVPALTWMATALAPYFLGATPVFVDINPETLCMDPAKMEAAITAKTKAVIPVHVYGSTADLEKILAVASAHHLAVVEDCAHMHGGFWNGRGVGSWGDVGSFSFQQSKTMSSGEGGICITNNQELAEKIYLLKHIGYQRGLKQGQAVKAPEGLICHNYRGTAFQAAILSEQLKTLHDRIRIYGESAAILRAAIADVPGVRTQLPGRLADPQGYYSFHFLFDGEEFRGISKQAINEACIAEGANIGNGGHGAVYQHVLFNLRRDEYRIGSGERCDVCEDLSARMLGISHEYLYEPAVARKIGEVVRKVASHPEELRRYCRERQR